jgi:hypothetical protein
MARLPTAQEDAALDAMFVPGTVYYLALFSTDPGTTGASGELSGGSYARQPITFGSASGGVKVSSGTDASQSFTNLPAEAGGIPYAAIYSAVTSGTYLGGLTTTGLSGAIGAGATVDFASGEVSWSQS